jgi:hypothetical protein
MPNLGEPVQQHLYVNKRGPWTYFSQSSLIILQPRFTYINQLKSYTYTHTLLK